MRICAFVGAVIVVVSTLVGCDSELAVWVKDIERTQKVLWNEEKTIKEDWYSTRSLDVAGSSALSITATLVAGPAVDLYVFDEQNYNRYKARMNGQSVGDGSFRYLSKFSCPGLSQRFSSGWVELSKGGRYYVILDNADVGDTSPPWDGVDNVATVDIKVTVKNW